MRIFAKRNAVDSEIIELYCIVDNELKYLAATIHTDFFNRKDFPFLDRHDEAELTLTEVH